MSPPIQLTRLSHMVGTGAPKTRVLQDVTLKVEAGTFIAIVGPSGCGKTTLLNLIVGLEQHRGSGSISVYGSPPKVGRPNVGYMLARDCLLPWRRARGNAELVLELQGVAPDERRARAEAALSSLGLAGYEDAYPAQLSQGMRQRVALARVFAARPDLILLDEPFSALDAQTRITAQEAFLHVWQSQNSTVVLVTHDLAEAVTLADHVYVMSGRPGQLIAEHKVDIPRPRSAAQLRSDSHFHDIHEAIWRDLRDEVMSSARLSPQ